MSKGLTITRHLPVPLTSTEKTEKHEELVRTITDAKRLEKHFALLKEQHKANMKARETRVDELTEELSQGFVMRPIACEQIPDLSQHRMVVKRLDTGETVEERALTAEEVKQMQANVQLKKV